MSKSNKKVSWLSEDKKYTNVNEDGSEMLPPPS